MRSSTAIVTTACLVSLIFVAAGGAAADEIATEKPGCTVYEHAEYDGASHRMEPGNQSKYFGDKWNDRVSSVRLSRGCRLIGYEHRDFEGEHTEFRSDAGHVGDRWNDQMSSAKCSCEASGSCEIFEHAEFDGRSRRMSADASSSYLGEDWNDTVSSVKVSGPCNLKVYEHRDFKGDSRTFAPGSHAHLGDRWNDQVSSARCSCGDSRLDAMRQQQNHLKQQMQQGVDR